MATKSVPFCKAPLPFDNRTWRLLRNSRQRHRRCVHGYLGCIDNWSLDCTINLYKSGEKQIGSSRQVATIQARQARQQFKFTKETADRQAEEIEAQLKIAGDNAKAAQKAADAAVAAERARFYAIVDHNFLECINRAAAWGGPLDQEERALPMDAQPMAGITFKNYGKTPGFVVDVSTGIVYSETIPTPVFDEKVIMENIISPGESTEKFGTLISGLLNMTQAKKVREGEGTIWVSEPLDTMTFSAQLTTTQFFSAARAHKPIPIRSPSLRS